MPNQNDIQIPLAKEIKGLTFRRFRNSSDYPKMVEVANSSWEADKAKWKISEDNLALEFEHPINFSPEKDVLLAEIDGELVGFSRLYWFKKPDGLVLYKHYAVLVPEQRGSGIWPAMVGFCEKRAGEIAELMPPGLKHYSEVWAAEEDSEWKSLLEGQGYKPSWFLFEMVRHNLDDVPDLPLPKGIEVRPVKPEQHRQIWDASKEAFKDERTYSEDKWSDEAYSRWLSDPFLQPNLWQIAWQEEEVVGGIHNYINRSQNKLMNRKWGWTERIFVRKSWRNQGIAKALIARSLKVLREQGMEAAALGVDTENPSGALKIYESMGYETNNQFTFYRKPVR